MDGETNKLTEHSIHKIYVADKTSFYHFASLLEEITKIDEQPARGSNSGIGKNEAKKRLLQKFMDSWWTTSKTLKSTIKESKKIIDDNFFTVLRLLLPHEDRRVYGLKETRLANFLIDALGISKTSEDAKKLMNYKAPSNVKLDGDFASVAYFILKNRCNDKKTLSINEANFYLDKIAKSSADGKNGQKELIESIQHLLTNLSALQLKWLLRVILKDLKIGIKEHLILEAYHPDAMDLYNFTSSLEKVCDTLTDPSKRLHEVGVTIMNPCRPMLGEKTKPTKIEQLLNGLEFYIETKYDGERFQLHKNCDNYAFFSRNSHDYSDTFGRDKFSGNLTPYIQNCFSNAVKNIIIDGEMCGYDPDLKQLLSKGEEFDIKSLRQRDSLQTCFCVFDILLYNDEVLTNKPLKERIKYLEKALSEIEGRLIFSKRIVAKTNQEVVDELNKAIDQRLEGIVIKNPLSVYKPSVRSGSGWYKVKPDYMLGLNDDMDLLIVGGYYGDGRRSGLLSHFLLAVALDGENVEENQNKNVDNEDLDLEGDGVKEDNPKKVNYPKTFLSFCKVGSGYSLKELYEFNQKLSDKWKPFDKKNPPKHLQLTYEKPDAWIDPKDSFIVQVKAVEICNSDKYKTGVSLRFPRLEAFRSDKSWHECMKLSELNELREKNDGKLTSGKHFSLNDYDEDGNLINLEDADEPVVKKKKMSSRNIKRVTLNDRYKGVDTSNIQKINDLFYGKEFCLIIDMGNEKYDKKYLETKIIEFGGEVAQNPGENTYCIITTKRMHKLNNYIKNDMFNIVKIEWLIKCIESFKWIEWKPSDMIYIKSETKSYFNQLYDSIGDSYTEDLTVESLKDLFCNIDNLKENSNNELKNKELIKKSITCFENKYFPDDSFKFGLFRLINAYIDIYEFPFNLKIQIKNSCLELIGLKIRWRGGECKHDIDDKITHCIVDKRDTSRLNEFKKLNRLRDRKFHLVSSDWVIDSIKASRVVNELPYHM